MLFTEPVFLPFFLLCFAVRWSLRGYGTQKTFLWAASYVFYGAWDVRFLLLLAGSTVVDYVVGRNIAAATSPARRRAWLLVCLCSNLGLLTILAAVAHESFDLASRLPLHFHGREPRE